MLTKYDPMRDFFRLSDNFFPRLVADKPHAFAPPVDIHETDDAVVIATELPGVKLEDVALEVEKGVLTLKGERKRTLTDEQAGVLRTERLYGMFERRFTLPDTVSMDDVDAQLQDGILTVTLKKRPEEKAKKIAIRQAPAAA